MSRDAVSKFLTRISEDSALRGSVFASGVTAETVAATAAQHGFHFTPEEFCAQIAPLSDAEWENAAASLEVDEHTGRYFLFLEEAPMSKEAVSAFLKKVAEDSSMQAKLIEFAAQEGFEFTAEELSDADLDSIAGGVMIAHKTIGTEGKIIEP